jgi:hypothetical protein
MSKSAKYVLDADVFIQANRQHYRFKVCPGFWSALLDQHKRGLIISIDKVKKELQRGKDELADWVDNVAPGAMFASCDGPRITQHYRAIISWVQNRDQYKPQAKAKFAGNADPWLIAYAMANGLVVVTHEESAELSKKKVKIPDVCAAQGVRVIDTFDMLADLNVVFELQK